MSQKHSDLINMHKLKTSSLSQDVEQKITIN